MPVLPKITRELVPGAVGRSRTKLTRAGTPGAEPRIGPGIAGQERIPLSIITQREQPKVPLNVGRQPRSTPEDFGGAIFEALGQVGNELMAVSARIKADEERGEAAKIVGDIGIDIVQGAAWRKENANYQNYIDFGEQNRKQIADQARERFKGMSRSIRSGLEQNLIAQLARAEQNDIARQSNLSILHQRGEIHTSLKTLARLVAQEPDPVAGARWQAIGIARIESLSTGVLGGIEPQKWKNDFIGDIQKETLVYISTDFKNSQDDLINKARRDPDNAPQYFQEGLINIAGIRHKYPKKELNTLEHDFGTDLWKETVLGFIDLKPSYTKGELKGGKYDESLDQKDINFLINKAEAEMTRRTRADDARKKENDRQVGEFVKSFEQARDLSFPWRGPPTEEGLAQMVRGTKHEARFLRVQADSKELDQFNSWPPVMQEQYLRERRRGPKTGDEAKLIARLERTHEATKQGLDDDPISFAINQGFLKDLPPPFDLNNPATLQEWSRLAGMVEKRYGVPVSPLTNVKARAVTRTLDDMPAEERANAYGAIGRALPDERGDALFAQFEKLGQKDSAVIADIARGDVLAAEWVLKGRQLRSDAKAVKGLFSTGAEKSLFERIDLKAQSAYRNSLDEHWPHIRQAIADAYLTQHVKAGFHKDKMDNKTVDEAIKRVTGGLLNIRGQSIVAPKRGVTESGFMRMLTDESLWKDLGSGFSKEIILSRSDAKFESAKSGRYYIRFGAGYVEDRNGKTFVLDLRNVATDLTPRLNPPSRLADIALEPMMFGP